MRGLPRDLPRPRELERLVDAENAWHGERRTPGPAGPAGASAPGASAAGGAGLDAVVSEVLNQARGHKQHRHDDRYGRSYGSSHPRRKKSFLSELFD